MNGPKDDVKNEGREDDRCAETSASLRRFEDAMEDGRSLISFAKKKEDVKNEGRHGERFAGTKDAEQIDSGLKRKLMMITNSKSPRGKKYHLFEIFFRSSSNVTIGMELFRDLVQSRQSTKLKCVSPNSLMASIKSCLSGLATPL